MGTLMDRCQRNRNVRIVMRSVVTGIVAAALVGCLAQSAPAQGGNPGLRGILPAEVPDGLTFEEFEALDGNWADWSAEVAELVANLYEQEDLKLGGQRKLLATLRLKLATMQKALDDPRYGSLHEPLNRLRPRLARRVQVATAILDTLKLTPEKIRAQEVAAAQSKLADALEAARADLNEVRGGKAWFGYIKADALQSAATAESLADADVEVLASVQSRLTNTESLNAEQQEFLSRDSLGALAAAAGDLHEAQTREIGTVDEEAVRPHLATLANSLEEFEASSSLAAATKMRDAFRGVAKMLPDNGARLRRTIRPHYLNFNLHIIASEGFLNRLVADSRTENGPVSDFILGARVSGNQTTQVQVGLDVKESSKNAVFDLTLSGVTRSRTRGVTSQATIFTSGNHRFRAAKEIRFDGDRFELAPARISVRANNTTTGASTRYSGVPIFGGIANGIAVGEANKRRPQSEAIAAARVSEQVIPKFNEEVDAEFETVNSELETRLLQKLRDNDLFPSARRIASTEDSVTISARLMGRAEVGGNRPPAEEVGDNQLLIQMHETLINNALDKMGLAGRTLSEEELVEEIENSLTELWGRPIKFDKSAAEDYEKPATEEAPAEDEDEDVPTSFVFDDTDPMRIQFRNGEVLIRIRAALLQEGKDDIPAQEVEVPITFGFEGDDLIVKSGRIRVSPVVKPDNLQTQIARAGVIRKKIEKATPDRKVDTNIEIEEEGRPTIRLKLSEVVADSGWVSIRFD